MYGNGLRFYTSYIRICRLNGIKKSISIAKCKHVVFYTFPLIVRNGLELS